MFRRVISAITIAAVGFVFPIVIFAGGEDKGLSEIPLPKKIHRLLSAEMNRIQNGMKNLTVAIPAGHWKDIVENSKKMREGYIMKKKLSNKQMETFNNSLPPGYLELDREFQEAAGRLTGASGERDWKKVSLYFYKLTESCIKCHTKYATKRFPDLKM